jgi:hypothetical protein
MSHIQMLKPCGKAVDKSFNQSLTMTESGLAPRAIVRGVQRRVNENGQLSFDR